MKQATFARRGQRLCHPPSSPPLHRSASSTSSRHCARVTTRDTGRRRVGQFESATPGHVHVAGMVRRLGLAVLIGLLAVGTFVARRHPATVEPPPSPQRPHAVIVPRLGPPGFCLLQPSGSLRCSQEPPWGRRTNPLLRPVSTASN